MGLMRIVSYLRGYVVIVVEGKHIEKFINLAVARGYNLWDIHQPSENLMLAKADLETFAELRHVARACRCRMRIQGKKGLPFITAKFRRRKMLAVGALVFFVALYILSSFIWSVEVSSTKELRMISSEQVLEAVSDMGLKPGAPRFAVDTKEIGETLGKEFPEISWVGVEVRGTRVIISVVEKILPEKDPERGQPGNIVAQKDGVIKELLVLSGEPRVAAGDTVKKGDILISGVIYPEFSPEEPEKPEQENDSPQEPSQDSEPRPVHVSARGIVRARIWYETQVQVPLIEEKEIVTGKTQQVVALELMGKRVVLRNEAREKPKHYRKQDTAKDLVLWKYRFPVRLVTTTFKEVEKKQFYYNMVEAAALAKEKALQDISTGLPQDSKVVSQRTEVSSSNEKELNMVVYVETLESIGGFSPLK